MTVAAAEPLSFFSVDTQPPAVQIHITREASFAVPKQQSWATDVRQIQYLLSGKATEIYNAKDDLHKPHLLAQNEVIPYLVNAFDSPLIKQISQIGTGGLTVNLGDYNYKSLLITRFKEGGIKLTFSARNTEYPNLMIEINKDSTPITYNKLGESLQRLERTLSTGQASGVVDKRKTAVDLAKA